MADQAPKARDDEGRDEGVADESKTASAHQGRQIFDEARKQAASYIDDRKNDAARSVSDIAASLRETGKAFGEQSGVQVLVDNAADGLEQLAGGLREQSFAELYGKAEAYARRSPVVVGAVGIVAGFLLARLIKSSSEKLSERSAAAGAEADERRPRPTEAEG